MRLATLAALATAMAAVGCTIDPPEGIFRCMVDADCPDDFVCRADRLCYRSGVDPVDAALPDGGVDAATDAGPPTDGDAGCVDTDMDGVCAVDDCNDDDRDVFPGATEACVDDAFVDDNCDGRVDETCITFIGTAHVLFDVYDEPGPDPTPNAAGHFLFAPWLSPDGLRLYYGGLHDSSVGQPLRVATRPTLDMPFGSPQTVGGTSGRALVVPALSDDELVVVAQGQDMMIGGLEMASRAAAGDPFGAFEAATPPPPAGVTQVHPTLSADGLELIYVEVDAGTRTLVRATRSSRAIAFGTATMILNTGTPQFPRLSADGLTLYVLLATGLSTLSRPSVDVTFDPTPTPFSAFSDAGIGASYAPVFHDATREVFFSRDDGNLAPSTTGIFRARVCRAGPCPTLEVPCVAPDVRSSDGLTCYHRTSDPFGIGATRDRCTTWGGTLAALHFPEAFAESASLRTEELFVDLFRDPVASPFQHFQSREPFLFARWAASEPSSSAADRCVSLRVDGTLDATSCLTFRRGLCMQRLWPTW